MYLTLYHATIEKHLHTIKKEGLKTAEGVFYSAKWYMLTDSLEGAKLYATGEEPIIIEYKIPIGEAKEYLWLPGEYSEYYGTQIALRKPLPSKYITEIITFEEEVRKSKDEMDRCKIAKQIVKSIEEDECRTDNEKCEIVKQITEDIIEKECSKVSIMFYRTDGKEVVGIRGDIIEELSKILTPEDVVYGTITEYGIIPRGQSYFKILNQVFAVQFDYEWKPRIMYLWWDRGSEYAGKRYEINYKGKRITRENILRVIIKVMAKEIKGIPYHDIIEEEK